MSSKLISTKNSQFRYQIERKTADRIGDKVVRKKESNKLELFQKQ